jgi:hypothetical protein
MKVSTLLIAGSLAANAALLAFYVSRPAADPASADAAGVSVETGAAANGSSSSGARKKGASGPGQHADAPGQTWAHLKPDDLRALVARMRAAGFPMSVIRSVLYTQINESFKARRAALAPTMEERPFWQTHPGGGFSGSFGYDQKYYAALRELGREQSQMVKDLLGADATSRETSPFTQRRYGNLSTEKIEQVQRLDQDYNELRNEVNTAARGIMLPEDREKLAILEKERRADLAQLLSPQEMEDYLMRTSMTTSRLRTALTTLNASEAEFRAIYQAQLAYDEKYANANMGGMVFNNADTMRERQAAQTDANAQIKTALGDQRYAEYVRASDREFQQLDRMAKQSSLPGTAALQTYDLRTSALTESNRIYDDASLSSDQKRAALQALGQTTRAQITSTLGADVGGRYLQVANRWLAGLDRGAAVTLTENNGMSFRNVAGPRPNPNAGGGAIPPAPSSPPPR